MPEISATIRLRPTRIGFLVQPNDLVSVRKIMRACACLWGGTLNPIIPVFRTPPREWRRERYDHVKGLAVARGYINFFEPDVIVESKHGLLEESGLGALRDKYEMREFVVPLKSFLTPQDHRDWSEPAFGLGIIDVFRHLYKTEQRFQFRDKRPSVLIKPERDSGIVDAIFGAYPRQRDTDYIANGYKDVFAPTELMATPESWLEVYKNRARTPLGITNHGIDSTRYWYHDPVVYVFDPARATDLIDFWNLCLEPSPVLPIPVDWFAPLTDHICEVLRQEYRLVRGNPSGIMHHATVEFSRSIAKDQADEFTNLLKANLPSEVLFFTNQRNRIWAQLPENQGPHFRRREVFAEESRPTLTVKDEQGLRAKFETLTPIFASRHGGHQNRWVNTVQPSAYAQENIATVLPNNLFDRSWPRLALGGDQVIVGSEGWVYCQQFKNWDETIELLTREDALIGTFRRLGIESKLSEPGHIAKQMLEHLGGLWNVDLLCDLETLQLINKMSGGVRRRNRDNDEIEENFERRSVSGKVWADIISRRKQKGALVRLELADFTKKNIIRLGLETDCPHCHVTNWHSLTVVDYSVVCERCLNPYDFPQSELRQHNKNWAYRVIGPFSVPDYGRGSYGALLTLRVLEKFSGASSEITYSTALDLEFDGICTETDFAVLWRKEMIDQQSSPELILGEAKSLGKEDIIKQKDLKKLKTVGRKLPGAVIVISVLRDNFTPSEKELLVPFVNWARRLDEHGRPTNPVILLTAHELFMDHFITSTWKALGEPYASYAEYWHTQSLQNFAEATQRVYLNIQPFHQWRDKEWKKRVARKKRPSRK